jgi:hypothetical protein
MNGDVVAFLTLTVAMAANLAVARDLRVNKRRSDGNQVR